MNNPFNFIESFVGKFGANADYVAQAAHFLAGFTAAHLFGYWGALGILLPWGITKEFYLDVKYENASYLDGLKDWGFYALGVVAGLLVRHWQKP